MNFITKRFGAKKTDSDTLAREIAKVSGEVARARARLPEVEAILDNLSVLSDAEHESAENELATLKRTISRGEAQTVDLQEGLSKAQKAERLAALKARAEQARRRVETDAAKALDRYEQHAPMVAQAVAEYGEIAAEVDAVNAELHKAGLPPIETPHRRYRCNPGRVRPEVREKREVWVHERLSPDGRGRIEKYDEEVGVLQLVDGQMVPTEAGARKVLREIVISPERIRSDAWLPSLIENVALPPGRVGAACHWPKA